MNQNWTPMPLPQQPMQPAPYQPLGPPPPPPKPSTFYKVVGILQITFGVGGMLWSAVSLALMAVATAAAPSSMAMYDTSTFIYLCTHTGMGILTGALLLGTGVGVVKAKRWARPLGVVYGGLSLAITLIGTAIQLIVIQPKTYAHMGGLGAAGDKLQLFSIVTTLFGAAIVAILPIFTIIVLLRGAAKQELDG
jgi:hypothetical protein